MLNRTRSGLVLLALIAVVAVGGMGLVGCAGGGQKHECARCAENAADADGGWCDHCGVGLYQGTKTKCKGCLEAKQTGGHCAA